MDRVHELEAVNSDLKEQIRELRNQTAGLVERLSTDRKQGALDALEQLAAVFRLGMSASEIPVAAHLGLKLSAATTDRFREGIKKGDVVI